MRGFQNPEERLPNTLFLAAVLLLFASLLYMVFVPRPSVAGLTPGKERSRKKLEAEIEQAKRRTREATTATRPRLSAGEPQKLTAQTLSRLTQLARARGLTLGGFRPQRPKSLPGLIELPYSVQLRGPFPAVRGFMTDLDAPGGRLVLRSLQLAASDGDTSAVTATIGISAFTESANPDDSETSNKMSDNRKK
jgi:hypothetical protein